jgi:NADPH2:quinone reductase
VPKAILVRTIGGPEVLEYGEIDRPSPREGELLVDVAATGVNYADTYHRGGMYPMELPFVPGLEGTGTVAEVGAGVSGFAPGDRVVWMGAMGSYAEQVLVRADAAVPVPDGIDDETAAATLLQGVTAHYLVNSTYPVQPGDTVLIHAAAGGVGLLLVQLAKAKGATVIGTVSTPDKEELARQAGADTVIRYTEADFVAETKKITGGKGVRVVYDGVGKTTFDGSMASLAWRGYLVLFGAASGAVPPVDPQRLNSGGSLYLTRPTAAHYTADPEELRGRAADLFGAIGSGTLSVRIGGSYPLSEARRAHEDLQSRRTTGKLLLIPGS